MANQLDHIRAVIEAHSRLVVAIEDFTNSCLSEGAAKRLREAMTESRKLIAEEEC
jgi:hypothetical protein